MTGAETAAIIAVTMGLVEVIKKLIEPLLRSKRESVLTPREHDYLSELHKMHNRYDADGVPLWYVPRSWADTQKDIVETQRELADNQRRIVEILDRMDQHLERVNEKLAEVGAR